MPHPVFSRLAFGALATMLSIAVMRTDGPAPHAPLEASAAFARLKTLVGDWKARQSSGDKDSPDPGAIDQKIGFRLTGQGSALVETMFPGTDHEMMTVYHLDGDDLVLTHYCAMGNQPRLKLDRAASTADDLHFAFNGGTNLDPARDPHMHEGRIQFRPDGAIVATWTGYAQGKPSEHAIRLLLTR